MRETVTLTRFHIWTTNRGLHVVNHLVAWTYVVHIRMLSQSSKTSLAGVVKTRHKSFKRKTGWADLNLWNNHAHATSLSPPLYICMSKLQRIVLDIPCLTPISAKSGAAKDAFRDTIGGKIENKINVWGSVGSSTHLYLPHCSFYWCEREERERN